MGFIFFAAARLFFRRDSGEKLEAQEGHHESAEHRQKSAKSVELAEVVSSRAQTEPSAEIGSPDEENESECSEIAVSGLENWFFQ